MCAFREEIPKRGDVFEIIAPKPPALVRLPDILNTDIIVIILFTEFTESSGEAVVTSRTLRN